MDPTSFDPTTLVTFIFRAPPDVRTVELLGSWDNFNIPYRMHHDRRRGTGFWTGCFKFENIIFDGWNLQWTKPRSGGLRQGGTYWYYYRLNYDLDTFDNRQPQTTSCPLLPGQKVNVIDVPVELVEPIKRCHSAYADIVGSFAELGDQQTLDPQDKFALLEPPPVSKVHSRSFSDAALKGRLESEPLVVVEKSVSPVSTPCSPRSKPAASPRGTTVFKERSGSSASTLYLQEGTSTDSATLQDSFPVQRTAEEAQLPSFPYPNTLGAAPLASLEALGAALFSSSEHDGRTSADRDAIEDARAASHQHDLRNASDLSQGPTSVRNVQFYGLRPGTNLTEDPEQYRSRMYSLPNLEIGDCVEDSPPESPSSYYSPQSYDPDESLTPEDETGNYDIVSPTFSAATISTGGHTTPFRLSAQNSIVGGTYVPTGAHVHDMGHVTDRLRELDTNDDHASDRRAREMTRSRPKPTTFVNYSLPTIASESNQSLAKTISHPSARPASRLEVPMPPSIFTEGEGTSIADDIFQELGFLGGSIA